MSSKQFYPFKDFQSDQIKRSSLKISTTLYACRNADLNLTLVMGTTCGFIFQIINSLTESWEGTLDLPWLYQVKINEKNHFSTVIMMSLFRWFSLFFIVCLSYTCHYIFLLWVFLFFSGLVYKRPAQGSAQYLGEYLFGQVPWAVGYAPLHCLTAGPHW